MNLDAFSSITGSSLRPATLRPANDRGAYRPARLERHAFLGKRQGERLSR